MLYFNTLETYECAHAPAIVGSGCGCGSKVSSLSLCCYIELQSHPKTIQFCAHTLSHMYEQFFLRSFLFVDISYNFEKKILQVGEYLISFYLYLLSNRKIEYFPISLPYNLKSIPYISQCKILKHRMDRNKLK